MKRINAILVALAIGIAAISLWSCNANDSAEVQNEIQTVENNASESVSVRILEAYNANLAQMSSSPRYYDFTINSAINQTRSRNREVFAADASGAFSGARCGFTSGRK